MLRLLALALLLLPSWAAAQCSSTCCSTCEQTSYEWHQGAQSGKGKSIEVMHCSFSLNWNCGPGGTPGQCSGPCPADYDVTYHNSYDDLDSEWVLESSCVYIDGELESEASTGDCPNNKPRAPELPATAWGAIKQLYRE